MPWLIRRRGDEYCVFKEGPNGEPEGESLGCHPSESAAETQRKALYSEVEEIAPPGDIFEIAGDFTDVVSVHELRGGYPDDIPHFPGVDVDALTEGDEKPVFLYIPIGKSGVTSGNKRYYDDEWLSEFERQTIDIKPVGLMGHLPKEEHATAFPMEAVHWIGSLRVDDVLWGKGYIPPGEARQRIQRYKAQGKKIATSIWAKCDGVWDAALGAFRMAANTLKLHQIDIAPADRAGLGSVLAAVPKLAAEMTEPPVVPPVAEPPAEQPAPVDEPTTQEDDAAVSLANGDHKEPLMEKLQIIAEMTADDATLLPQPVREAILNTATVPGEVALVAEIRTALGLDETADLAKTIGEMKQSIDTHHEQEISDYISELVADADSGIKIEAVRGLVAELVSARNPDSKEAAKTIYGEIVESDAVKELLDDALIAQMGPSQTTPTGSQNKGQKDGKYFTIPKIEQAA